MLTRGWFVVALAGWGAFAVGIPRADAHFVLKAPAASQSQVARAIRRSSAPAATKAARHRARS